MKNLQYLFLALILGVGISGCASQKSAEAPKAAAVDNSYGDDLEEVKSRATDLYERSEKINKEGGVVEVGSAKSEREDFAKEKAMLVAQGQIAQRIEQKVEVLGKKFAEEIQGNTSGGPAEINEGFTKVIKSASKTMITGATIIGTPKTYRNKKSGEYTVYVLYGMDPKMTATAINDQAKLANPKLYERFRMSQAFQDLQKEMDNYDKSTGTTIAPGTSTPAPVTTPTK